MGVWDRWSVPVTAVANEFIDSYMAKANGEYVKVYMFVLRHQGEAISVERIADALEHTESDVRRALSYWTKLGVLHMDGAEEEQKTEPSATAEAAAASAAPRKQKPAAMISQPLRQPEKAVQETGEANGKASENPIYSADQVNRLAEDEEFSQLLYIAQKYLNKVFTPRDCQVFAYLYDSLGMNSELLEYLVEYCAQNGHTSIRYLETVALSWHEKGIRTVPDAQDFCASYTRDSFAVMKAFGLGGRKPAQAEQKLMDKWFKELGFTREIVLEACGRTIHAIHEPSFPYADKILSDWHRAGVRTREDIKIVDARRAADGPEKAEGRDRRLKRYGEAGVPRQGRSAGAPNQFHNFKQRDTDYDALVLKQVKEWVGSGGKESGISGDL